MGERLCGFAPVFAPDARVLICGSMPSVESLKQGFYYAHPRNAFWPMMAEILGEDAPETVADKKTMLIKHRIALWDSAQSCEREGSLDSAIREPVANDFAALFAACPDIRAILFNGAKSYELYKKLVGRDERRGLWRLPSTSPAYTMRYEDKKRAWEAALREVLYEHESL